MIHSNLRTPQLLDHGVFRSATATSDEKSEKTEKRPSVCESSTGRMREIWAMERVNLHEFYWIWFRQMGIYRGWIVEVVMAAGIAIWTPYLMSSEQAT